MLTCYITLAISYIIHTYGNLYKKVVHNYLVLYHSGIFVLFYAIRSKYNQLKA